MCMYWCSFVIIGFLCPKTRTVKIKSCQSNVRKHKIVFYCILFPAQRKMFFKQLTDLTIKAGQIAGFGVSQSHWELIYFIDLHLQTIRTLNNCSTNNITSYFAYFFCTSFSKFASNGQNIA